MNVEAVALQNAERKQIGTLFTPENIGSTAVLFVHG